MFVCCIVVFVGWFVGGWRDFWFCVVVSVGGWVCFWLWVFGWLFGYVGVLLVFVDLVGFFGWGELWWIGVLDWCVVGIGEKLDLLWVGLIMGVFGMMNVCDFYDMFYDVELFGVDILVGEYVFGVFDVV